MIRNQFRILSRQIKQPETVDVRPSAIISVPPMIPRQAGVCPGHPALIYNDLQSAHKSGMEDKLQDRMRRFETAIALRDSDRIEEAIRELRALGEEVVDPTPSTRLDATY